ncbi:hypothetical protein JIN77_02540 [Verrucomicrobiaceae bacterium R5-34]|nr:hypothetical protein [Verrucomicrobiaceae bacterium R5-34]
MIFDKKLPRLDRPFKPGYWIKPNLLLPGKSFVLCGERSEGKSTLLDSGLTELAKIGYYREEDVDEFDGEFATNTTAISRFSLQRNNRLKPADSWIDCDGLQFSKVFIDRDTSRDDYKNLSKIYSKVDAMVLVVSVQRLVDLHTHFKSQNDGIRKGSSDVIDRYRESIEHLTPTFCSKLWSISSFQLSKIFFKWHFVVTQVGDFTQCRDDWKELKDAVNFFSKKTGLRKLCSHAYLCDSKHKPLESMGVAVAKPAWASETSYDLKLQGPRNAMICTAGAALSTILGETKPANQRFNHTLKK